MSTATANASSSHGTKRSASSDNADVDDDKFQTMLAQHSANVEWLILIDTSTFPTILISGQLWDSGGLIRACFWICQRWQGTVWLCLPLDVLSNGCSVFLGASLLGKCLVLGIVLSRISWWYKAAMNLRDVFLEVEDEEFPVLEVISKIPPEWEQDWWKTKLWCEVRPEVLVRFHEDTEWTGGDR